MIDPPPAFPVEKILQSFEWLLKTHGRIPWTLRDRLEADLLALEALTAIDGSHKRTGIRDSDSGVELLDSRAKAKQLGCSIRWIQKNAVKLGGFKLSGRWMFDA